MKRPCTRTAAPGLRAALAGCAALAACVGGPALNDGPERFTPAALAGQMLRQPVVLLGEVHDNSVQHAVRAQALRQLLQGGARPALAFEQFDRERQPDIDRVLLERDASPAVRVDRLVALGARGWNWDLYRPFLQLAVEYDLPVVAADLSRADAMRVSHDGYAAVFGADAVTGLGLDHLPPTLLREQEKAVEEGHCHQMPADMLPAIARAQIARDAALAQAIGPYLKRGLVLLTGNGHARRDIGVPRFLPEPERSRVVSIALLEADSGGEAAPPGAYDAVFHTPIQARADPCKSLHFDRDR